MKVLASPSAITLNNLISTAMAPRAIHAEAAAIAREEAPEIPYVNWRKDPGLRKLYMLAAVVCVASATTGYDGYAFSS